VRHWNPLRAGSGTGVVLAVDFGNARVAAGFADLEPHLDLPYALWEAVPLSDEPAPAAYLRRWAGDAVADGDSVAAVIGYCAGGTLARHLAECLADEFGQDPKLVLIDPELVTADLLYAQFTRSLDALDDEMPVAGPERVRERGRNLVLRHRADIERVAAELSDSYRPVAHEVFRCLGLGDDIAAELADRFQDFMSYLALAGRLQDQPWSSTPVVIRTAEQDYPVPPAAQHIRLRCGERGALGERAVADAVSAVLTGTRAR